MLFGSGRASTAGILARRRLPIEPIVPADGVEEADQKRDGDDHHPRAVRELRRDHDRRHERGHRRADAVEGRLQPPPSVAVAEPVPNHPGLRQREGGEDPDHVQVDERVDVGAEGEIRSIARPARTTIPFE